MNFVFHQAALGDWVLTFPVLRALTPVVAVAPDQKAKLASLVIDGVQPCGIEGHTLSQLHSAGGADKVSSDWQKLLAQAQVIVSFICDSAGIWAQNMRQLAPRAKIAGVCPLPDKHWHRHVCVWHDRQLRSQGVRISYETATQRSCEQGVIVIAPGSGGRNKCWPADRFEKLIVALRQGGNQVRVVLGEVEVDRWPSALLGHWRDALGAHIVLSLAELHAQISAARLFIGNDSGPTHLAAAMGIRTLALFGRTDPAIWSPRGPLVTVVAPARLAPMDWLSTDRVLEEVALRDDR